MSTHCMVAGEAESTQLGNTLERVSNGVLRTDPTRHAGEVYMPMVPMVTPQRIDCRIEVLQAVLADLRTWIIGTIPDLDEWARGVARWIVELPTEDLIQMWMACLIVELCEHVGLSTERASLLIQCHVGEALAKQEGRRCDHSS